MQIPENARRIFLAVGAPAETPLLLEQLKQSMPSYPSLKWMRPYNLHLTLYFMGNVASENYTLVTELYREVLSRFSTFTLKFDSLVAMPSWKPRMIWARYHKHSEFTRLYYALHNASRGILESNFEAEQIPVPHITLARFYGLKIKKGLSIPSGYMLPDITVSEAFIWETKSVNGQHDYVQNEEGLKLSK